MTQQAAPLMVWVRPGEAPEVAEPVPELSLVSIETLLSPTHREWLTLAGADVELNGHRWRIVGWQEDALVWRYLGRG